MHELTPSNQPAPEPIPLNTALPSLQPTSSVLDLSPSVRALGLAAIERQLWCLGQDIRRPEGNLLIEYGFERNRPGVSVMGSSAYSLDDGSTQLTVWGWGIAIAKEGQGALWIRRNNFEPQWSPIEKMPSTVFRPEDLPRSVAPSTTIEEAGALELFHALCDTLTKYETWISLNTESSYRTDVLSRHASRRQEVVAVEGDVDMTDQWLTISELVKGIQ